MSVIGWIRDLFGIQKDMYETKKTRLEIEKIEDEKREKLITPATMEDIEKYDPKTQRLVHKVRTIIILILLLIMLLLSVLLVPPAWKLW